jgi:hypothetical protein
VSAEASGSSAMGKQHCRRREQIKPIASFQRNRVSP